MEIVTVLVGDKYLSYNPSKPYRKAITGKTKEQSIDNFRRVYKLN